IFQAEDGIRDLTVTGVQTCALPILPRVPYTLAQATDTFEKSEFAKRAFGADVVEHYAHFFRTEVAAYDKAVTDWERKRYFERIRSEERRVGKESRSEC